MSSRLKSSEKTPRASADAALKCILLSTIAVACLVASACQDGTQPHLSEAEIQKAIDSACSKPFTGVAALDGTGSMKSTATRPAVIDDFNPLIDRLSECGGEIAVIYIRDQAETGAERLLFPEPPALPARPIKQDDEEPYELSDRLDNYNSKLLERVQWIEANRAAMQPRIDAFLAAVKRQMERPAAKATDFNSAINSADVLLAEGNNVWAVEPEKYLIIVSDAIDTQKRPRFDFRSGANIYWVNTTTDDKALAGLRFTRFESFPAAVRNIVEGNR